MAMSLFAERKIIDLRLPSGKPGKEGGAALVEYAERPPEDTVLLITSGKVSSSSPLLSTWVNPVRGSTTAIR